MDVAMKDQHHRTAVLISQSPGTPVSIDQRDRRSGQARGGESHVLISLTGAAVATQ